MNTHNTFHLTLPPWALAIALLGMGCGNDTTDTDGRDGTNATTTTTATDNANGSGTAAGGNTTADQDRAAVNTMDPNGIRIVGSTQGTPIYDERYAASSDIRGYRTLLMAELEAIRARLNDGTRPAEATKQDQERAADLAQGLERMDRLIKAVEESDEPTWTSIRESQLKEAGEVRIWAREHGYAGS